MLVPGLEYTFETLVECVSDLGIADQIRVFVLRDSFPPNVIRYAYEQRFPAIFSLWTTVFNLHEVFRLQINCNNSTPKMFQTYFWKIWENVARWASMPECQKWRRRLSRWRRWEQGDSHRGGTIEELPANHFSYHQYARSRSRLAAPPCLISKTDIVFLWEYANIFSFLWPNL